METVTSKDGTKIAYKKQGSGPAIVLVDGALCWTEAGVTPLLMPVLSKNFTVYAYDRRGRGGSGNIEPYAVEREIEDLAAVMEAAGKNAYMCGFSSGAGLAFYAAAAGLTPKKLILYEAPFTVVDSTDKKTPADAVAVLDKLIASGERQEAVDYFMKNLMDMPSFMLTIMKLFGGKGFKQTKLVAHTLPYDIRIMDQTKFEPPREIATKLNVPTLVLHGDKTAKKLMKASRALAESIPGAELMVVPNSSHMVKPEMLTPLLVKELLG